MYAVFRTGGKQYRAATGDVLRLEKIDAEEGATIEFDEVLLVGEGADVKVGSPLLDGGSVSAKVLRQGKTRKVPVVKFRRRQNYLRQGSHRQQFTEVEITGIAGEGSAKPAAKAQEKQATTKKAAAKKPATKKKATTKKATGKDTGAEKVEAKSDE
jgi:large subunit ribosomal protein L21